MSKQDAKAPDDAPPEDAPAPRVSGSMLGRIGPAAGVMVTLFAAAYAIPQLEFARPWTPEDPVPFWNLLGRPFEQAELAEAEERHAEVEDFARQALADPEPLPIDRPRPEPEPEPVVEPGDKPPAYEPREEDLAEVQQSIELFEGDELDPFFARLKTTDQAREETLTRVVHWGDSAIGLDGITGSIRRRMQARFGDGGHGFHLIAPPNNSYRHYDVRFTHNEEWEQCFIIRKCKKDGRYGLGGATAWSYGGAESTFALSTKRTSGKISRFAVYYLAGPKTGKIKLRVDREAWQTIDTKIEGEVEEDRVHVLELSDEPHKITVRAGGGGLTRLYGVSMERPGPGVVWDGLAMVGAFTNRHGELDETHLEQQLELRQADLAVLMFGGNDMVRDSMSDEQYATEYAAVLANVRAAAPNLPCVVMTPLDHGERKGARIVSRPIVPRMVAVQRKVADEAGCAFFDTYAAMGGEGSVARWYESEPRLIGGDLSHATGKGHVVIGEMFFRALIEQYVAYRKREG